MTNTLTFTCSICGEPSTAICAYCTKDSCNNHLCERCARCSDCCECEVRLEEPFEAGRNGAHAVPVEQLDGANDQPVVDEVETAPVDAFAEEERDEMPLQPESVDSVTTENSEHKPLTIASVDTASDEPAPPQTPPPDEHHE